MILNTSCTSVKAYQKNKLNDAEMSLSSRKAEKTELNFQSYREGGPRQLAGRRVRHRGRAQDHPQCDFFGL